MANTNRLSIKALLLSVLVLLNFSDNVNSQDTSESELPKILNGNFESGELGEAPSEWRFNKRFGTAQLTDENSPNDSLCCHVSVEKKGDFPAGLAQSLDAKPFIGKRIRLSGSIRSAGSGSVQMWMRFDLKPVGGRVPGQTFYDSTVKRNKQTDQWTSYEIVGDVLEGSDRISLGAYLWGEGDFWIDDVSIEVVDENTKVTAQSKAVEFENMLKNAFKRQNKLLESKPGIYLITGSRDLVFREKGNATIRSPLPLSYRDQVPISYQYTVEPESAIESLSIVKDKLDNYVAEVVIKPVEGETRIKLGFKSTVLVGPSNLELPKKEIPLPQFWPDEAAPWLEASWCADSNHKRIIEIGEEILDETRDVMKIIWAVQKRARKIQSTAKGRVKFLTAVEALDHRGSCTSNANLVAALLRACNVPARVLAGYPSWSGPLQTHYIVEAYVPEFGWYPIESTMLMSPWPNSGQVNVSIVPVEYESRELAGPRMPNAGGVPYLSLTEQDGKHFGTRGSIKGKPGCDHVCKLGNLIDANSKEWKSSIKEAKTNWQQWLDSQSEPVPNNLLFGDKGHLSNVESLDELK